MYIVVTYMSRKVMTISPRESPGDAVHLERPAAQSIEPETGGCGSGFKAAYRQFQPPVQLIIREVPHVY